MLSRARALESLAQLSARTSALERTKAAGAASGMAAVSGAALEPLGAALGELQQLRAAARSVESRHLEPLSDAIQLLGAGAREEARRRRKELVAAAASVDDELGDDCAALDARLASLRAGVEEGPAGAAVAPPPPPPAAAEAPTDDDGDDTNDALLLALKEQIRDVKRQMKRLETRRGAGAKARKK